MRFLSFISIIISTTLFSTLVNAYNDIHARGIEDDGIFARGEELYDQFQRRSDFLSEIDTRELVEEIQGRLARRTLTNMQKFEEAKRRSQPLELIIRPDMLELKLFAALAKADPNMIVKTLEKGPASPAKAEHPIPPVSRKNSDMSGVTV